MLTAYLSISQYSGQSQILHNQGTDKHGNPLGDTASLGQKGGFKGKKIAVFDFYGKCGKLYDAPLKQMGFELIKDLSAVEADASPDTLRAFLAQVDQLWIISSSESCKLSPAQIEVIVVFNAFGGGLYLWADNEPFVVEANAVLARISPGVSLDGDYEADKLIGPMISNSGPGFVAQHPIFTGVVKLYEGETICTFSGIACPRIKFVMNNSEGKPALGIIDDQKAGRVAIDCGYTRLFCKWNGAGTARFVCNIAAWLCSPDKDW